MKQIYLLDKQELIKKKYFIKFIDDIKDEVIVFIDKNNKIRVFSSICPHFGGAIQFDYKNDLLRCKWHGWKFSKENGKCLTHPIKGKLNAYNFEVNPGNLNKYLYLEENKNIFILYD